MFYNRGELILSTISILSMLGKLLISELMLEFDYKFSFLSFEFVTSKFF